MIDHSPSQSFFFSGGMSRNVPLVSLGRALRDIPRNGYERRLINFQIPVALLLQIRPKKSNESDSKPNSFKPLQKIYLRIFVRWREARSNLKRERIFVFLHPRLGTQYIIVTGIVWILYVFLLGQSAKIKALPFLPPFITRVFLPTAHVPIAFLVLPNSNSQEQISTTVGPLDYNS